MRDIFSGRGKACSDFISYISSGAAKGPTAVSYEHFWYLLRSNSHLAQIKTDQTDHDLDQTDQTDKADCDLDHLVPHVPL